MTQQHSNNEAALDSRARRAARSAGLVARKSRWRVGTPHNRGGYMLLEAPPRSFFVRGQYFELSAEDVIEFCHGDD